MPGSFSDPDSLFHAFDELLLAGEDELRARIPADQSHLSTVDGWNHPELVAEGP